MQHSPNDIKEKLLRSLDKDNNVVDMATVIEVIAILEKTPITKDELERTRLGKYINELRKKTTNEVLAKRAKDLVRRWRKLILPQDNSGVHNGERTTHHSIGGTVSPCCLTTSHFPGPGPGPGLMVGGSKPASPALVNHLRPVKGISGLAQLSPGNSQCSSASTSPSVSIGGRLGSSRPTTPSTSSSHIHRFGGSSGAPMGDGCLQSNFHGFKPVSPAPITTGVGRHATPGGSSAKQSLTSSVTSPATQCSLIVDNRTRIVGSGGSGIKRPRPDEDESCDSQAKYQPESVAVRISSSPLPIEGLINGIDAGDSMDSFRSGGESLGDPVEIRDSSSSMGTNLAKSKKKNSRLYPEKCDMLKAKLASQLRISKVKTTAELRQELKARNPGSSAVRTSSPSLDASGNGEDHNRMPIVQEDTSLVHTRKAVYSSLLGTDEDLTRNKTELMEKFLKDSVGTDISSSMAIQQSRDLGGKESPSLVGPSSESSRGACDPVDAILANLPPIRAEDIKWSEDEEEEEGNANNDKGKSPDKDVTEEMVQRLSQSNWEGVNGNSDHMSEFKRWNEICVQQSYNNDLLHILPYVDID